MTESHGSETHPTARRILRTTSRLLKVLTALAVIVTGVVMVLLGPAAVIPAIAMAFLYAAWMTVAALHRRTLGGPGAARSERRSDEEEARGRDEVEPEPREVRAARRRARWKTVLPILGVLALMSIIVAAAIFEWTLVALGALVTFAWLVLSGGPFWIAAAKEQSDKARREVTGVARSIR